MDILKELFLLSDKEYASFQSKLTPTVKKENFIGVRVPLLRGFAKKIKGSKQAEEFLKTPDHRYYDESMLHALLINEEKDYNNCIKLINEFLPYVNNWAVCDVLNPKVLKKHLDKTIDNIYIWTKSEHTYVYRFGVGILMGLYLDDAFKEEYLKIPAKKKSEEYYVNMMNAWFFATALAKQWNATIPYLQKGILPVWVHNKTITKACESYRITEEQKVYLKTLKK